MGIYMVNRKTRRSRIVRKRNKSYCNKFKGGVLRGGEQDNSRPPGPTARNTGIGLATMQRIDNLERDLQNCRRQLGERDGDARMYQNAIRERDQEITTLRGMLPV